MTHGIHFRIFLFPENGGSWAIFRLPALWVEDLVGDLRAGMGGSREEGSSPVLNGA